MLIIIYFVDLGGNGKNGLKKEITIIKKDKKKRRRKRETRSVETDNKQTNKKKIIYITYTNIERMHSSLCCAVTFFKITDVVFL